jgi:hypothetical protein
VSSSTAGPGLCSLVRSPESGSFQRKLEQVTAIFLLVTAIFLSIVLSSLGGSGNQSVSFFVRSASLCSLTALPRFFVAVLISLARFSLLGAPRRFSGPRE